MTESIADIAVQHQKNRGTFHHNRMYIIAAAASTSQKKSQRFSTNISFLLMGTSKNRFEKGKWVECAECEESRRSKAVCLTRRFDEAGGVLYTFSLKQGF